LIIRPSAVNLGYILRSIPHSSFKMDTFNDRLRLQKRGLYAVKSAPETLTEAKRILERHQRYGDIVLAFTLRDVLDSGQDLELNARPAFVQSPSSIALLKPEERKEQIIIDVVKQYG